VGVSSGSDALLMVLMALKIGPGDEVITSPFTFFATAGAIHRVGARPVFADIDPKTYNLDPKSLKSVITSRTKAVIPVHLFGQCAQMDSILEIAEPLGIHVIEDAAQAIGAEYRGKRAGSMGIAGCFSFFPSKNLGGAGDGGMVTTNDPEFAQELRIFRNHGSNPKYYHHYVGGNFRLDALQAAVLGVKLNYLDNWTKQRQKNADLYRRLFKEKGLYEKGLKAPFEDLDMRHIYNQFCISVPKGKRDDLKSKLSNSNIGCEIYYPVPLHLQKCFEYLGYSAGDFPVSEDSALRVLALPVYPELCRARIEYTVNVISDFFNK
jgi:dTDP-4-amino-4,6-dideoxygalactose transaminase